ncbi:Heavy metal RND efflux outer membrane protein, CzcC family protein [Minicystis rosea]|nr:Heavy metal RND efflux outer membrane protein, CzcC family protein [Minicystis rosea]
MAPATPAFAAVPDAPSPEAEVPTGGVPTLPRVIALARERAPLVAAAREDVAVGRAEQVGARLPPVTNPYLEVQVQRGTLNVTKDVAMQATLFVPVEISGQRGRRMAEADALLGLREAELETARATAVGETVRAYGAAAVAGARVRTWQRLVGVARDEADIYAARLAARDATEQDATLARVELAKNSVVLAEARADLTRALADVSRLTAVRFTEAPASAEPPEPTRRPEPQRAPQVRAYESEADYHLRVRERQTREAHSPLSLIVLAGRGDMGETRFGGGFGWTLPIARTGQGEAARADASRLRALALRNVSARNIAAAVAGMTAEREQVRRALDEVTRTAEPAARAAIDAAVATQRAGKGDLLAVLTARRDLALLEARRLELTLREWNIVSDIVTLTGELP